jgi:hypothetical protein
LEAVVKAAESQPALLKFVEEVACLKYEGEPGDDGEPSEDSIATLNQLILAACQLLGAADKRQKCEAVVPYVIGYSGGAEVSQDRFDAWED